MASALRYRAQAPILDALLNELGLAATDPGGLTALVRKQVDAGMGNDGNEDTRGAAVRPESVLACRSTAVPSRRPA